MCVCQLLQEQQNDVNERPKDQIQTSSTTTTKTSVNTVIRHRRSARAIQRSCHTTGVVERQYVNQQQVPYRHRPPFNSSISKSPQALLVVNVVFIVMADPFWVFYGIQLFDVDRSFCPSLSPLSLWNAPYPCPPAPLISTKPRPFIDPTFARFYGTILRSLFQFTDV